MPGAQHGHGAGHEQRAQAAAHRPYPRHYRTLRGAKRGNGGGFRARGLISCATTAADLRGVRQLCGGHNKFHRRFRIATGGGGALLHRHLLHAIQDRQVLKNFTLPENLL